jgi:hypothetical protein
VVVVDGTYEDAVVRAAEAGAEPGVLELADVGAPAGAMGDRRLRDALRRGGEQATSTSLLVPVGVGSLAAAAARFGARAGVRDRRRAGDRGLPDRVPAARRARGVETPGTRWPGSTAPRSPTRRGRRCRPASTARSS